MRTTRSWMKPFMSSRPKNKLIYIKEVPNRKKAIQYCINILGKNDFLLIAGKGHENYQIIKNKKFFFSDKQTVKEFINK